MGKFGGAFVVIICHIIGYNHVDNISNVISCCVIGVFDTYLHDIRYQKLRQSMPQLFLCIPEQKE